ncbi:MAG: class I SAM-dependent methyltransferase, partial [Acidimicrobiia bacterium]
ELARAEQLPFADQTFDATLAQLVVHFMKDPVVGIREMARVTRQGGVVAACVWDHAGNQGPLNVFWDAARELAPDLEDESQLPGTSEGHLAHLFAEAGVGDIEGGALTIAVVHPTFDEWWEPFTLGVGPAGAYLLGLDPQQQVELRDRCRGLLPPGPFTQTAVAWSARGQV